MTVKKDSAPKESVREKSAKEEQKSKVVEHTEVKPPSLGERRENVTRVTLDLSEPEGKLRFNKDTALFILYLFYKANMITRLQLKNYFRIIGEPVPEDVPKWLLKEAAKG